jgi:hypothetical protein
LPTWSILVVTNSLPANSGALTTLPRPLSLAALRGQVSKSLPPFATSVRITCATGSVPFSPISCTTLLEPRPMTGSISPVPGMRRCGIAPCASAPGRGVATAGAPPSP